MGWLWYGLVLVWFGMVSHGTVCYIVVWMVWYMIWEGMVIRYGRYGTVWYGMFGLMWYGVV